MRCFLRAQALASGGLTLTKPGDFVKQEAWIFSRLAWHRTHLLIGCVDAEPKQ